MFMDIDRYQIAMDGETVFNGEFYKNLFVNIYNHNNADAGNDTNDTSERYIETKRYYIPKNQWMLFWHFLEECPRLFQLNGCGH